MTSDGSRVHVESIGQVGTQLCSGSIAMATPQTFTMASRPASQTGIGVDPRQEEEVVHCNPAHIHQI
jgi:hypothetical protein